MSPNRMPFPTQELVWAPIVAALPAPTVAARFAFALVVCRFVILDPKCSFKSDALDTLFRLDDHTRWAELGRRHGRRGLAAEPWPRKV